MNTKLDNVIGLTEELTALVSETGLSLIEDVTAISVLYESALGELMEKCKNKVDYPVEKRIKRLFNSVSMFTGICADEINEDDRKEK